MKKILAAAVLAFAFVAAHSQERVVERTYISTDKDVYVAGETLWCSAFCLDVNHGCTPSQVSSVAYLELHSADGVPCVWKVALCDGRGAGSVVLPASLPTGNYRLIAYTAQNKNEEGYDWQGIASKTISVYNAFTSERVKDGVKVVGAAEYESLRNSTAAPSASEGIEIRVDGDSIVIANKLSSAVTLSVSVSHDDGFASNGNPSIADFAAAAAGVGDRKMNWNVVPDYEGEVIRARVAGYSEDMVPEFSGKYAFISTPSDKSDVYTANISENGEALFFTNNIYGDKEFICEIENMDPSLNCHLELVPPFVKPDVPAPAPLAICSSLSDALTARAAAMQIEKKFASDTLKERLPYRENPLFADDVIRYVLDDYTRFPVMEELFIEFIQEIKARRGDDGRRDIRVRISDFNAGYYYSSGSSLMMLDGVPVLDQEKIFEYDPLLVESINIYPHLHYVGARQFEGIVNFVTYKRNLPSFKFSNNARVIDFQGVSWPEAYTAATLAPGGGSYPDYRQTIYWHPLVSVGAGGTSGFRCVRPDYKGRFRITVEGLAADGSPVSASAWIENL